MKRRSVVVLSFVAILAACSNVGTSSSDASTNISLQSSNMTDERSSEIPSISSSSIKTRTSKGSEQSSESVSSSKQSSSTKSSASSSELSSVNQEDKIYTIAEIKELCKQVNGLNQSGIAIDTTRTFTIRGLAISKFSLVKTTSKFAKKVLYTATRRNSV